MLCMKCRDNFTFVEFKRLHRVKKLKAKEGASREKLPPAYSIYPLQFKEIENQLN